MSKRKERKERKNNLIREWVLKVNDFAHSEEWDNENEARLIILFNKFCKEKGIDRPQDRSLRTAIILGGKELIETIATAYYQNEVN